MDNHRFGIPRLSEPLVLIYIRISQDGEATMVPGLPKGRSGAVLEGERVRKTMDIKALSQVSGAVGGPAGVAADSSALLSQIAANSALTDGERSALVESVALADGLADQGLREVVLSQVQGLGIFLKNAGDRGLPRWSVMTALRAYGLNLEEKPRVSDAGLVAQARANLSRVAESHGHRLNHALHAVKAAAPVAEKPVYHAVKIEKIA